MNLDKFRIWRTDKNNVTIQELMGKPGKEYWKTRSYHGNSAFSLISGLLELIMSQYTPEAGKLASQLETMKLELVLGVERLEKLMEDSKTLALYEIADNVADDPGSYE